MSAIKSFKDLELIPKLLEGLSALGYETPSPIQELSIPILLSGRDLIAQAQTGTGKTAAFALPLLQQLDLTILLPQAIILAPTRELAIQVAEAFKSYARFLPSLRVLPIYGGQEFGGQLKALTRGVHVVVGTPGRVMDHLRRGSLSLQAVKNVVLDEADEMLKMGFLEDVEWILQQIPDQRQMALFSATMPPSIQKVANQYLREPKKIHIKAKSMTATGIEQFFMQVANSNKLEALTRYLEIEDFDGMLIFTRTKNATMELAEKIDARGYAVAAMNGDMSQALREKTIARLKKKSLDIVIATDVAARGLDVDRISHVINYDAPYDPESYVHRIGRTGRAGRTGKSLIFINPREHYLLRDIEATTQHKITLIEPPSVSQIQKRRLEKFSEKIRTALTSGKLDYYRELAEKVAYQCECSHLDVAAALASFVQKDKPPKEMEESSERAPYQRRSSGSGSERRAGGGSGERRRTGGDASSKRRASGGASSERRTGGGAGDSRKSGGFRGNASRSSDKKKAFLRGDRKKPAGKKDR